MDDHLTFAELEKRDVWKTGTALTALNFEKKRLVWTTQARAGRMDLLTVVMHELGHVLGLADIYNQSGRNNLISPRASAGCRKELGPVQRQKSAYLERFASHSYNHTLNSTNRTTFE